MMTQIQVPDWLAAEAAPAFSRITDHLWRRGAHGAPHIKAAAIAAQAAWEYTRIIEEYEPNPADIEEIRQAARKLLAAMAWHLDARSLQGKDRELVDLCKPLHEKERNA